MLEDDLNFDVEPFKEKIKKRVFATYEDDLGTGDVTTNSVIKPMNIKAVIIAKDDGILAGVFEARSLLEKVGVKIKELKKEGSQIKKGDIVLEMEGDAKKIMNVERTVLNFLVRLSGIATLTNKMVKSTKTKLAATRKTCFSFSDKRAVKIGGGYTHRLGLFDMYLIKGNHIDIVCKELNCSRIEAIKECLRRVRENKNGKKIEIEVESVEEALAAAEEKPDVIMLDWVKIPDVKNVVSQLKKSGICIEASGGITPDNIKEFGEAGVDYASSGYITYSCKGLDMSLEIVKE